MKKVFSFLLSIIMIISIFTGIDFSTQASTLNPDLGEDFNIYMAKVLLNYDYQGMYSLSDSGTTPQNYSYNYCKNPSSLSFSRILLNELQHNDKFMGSLKGWNFLTFKPSTGLEKIAVSQVEYYEMIILNVLDSAVTHSIIPSAVKRAEKNYSSLTKELTKINDKIVVSNMDKITFSDFSDSECKSMVNAIAQHSISLNHNIDTIDTINDWIKSGTTVKKVVEYVSSMETVAKINEDLKSVVEMMLDSCPTDNINMRRALNEIIDSFNSTFGRSCNELLRGITLSSQLIIDRIVDDMWKKGLELFLGSEASLLLIGQAIGKAVSNIAFSTDEITEQYYSIKALVEFEDVVVSCVNNAADKFKSEPTADNANILFEAVGTMMRTYLISVDYAKDFSKIINTSGLWNQISSIFSGQKKQEYEQFSQTCESMKKSIILHMNTQISWSSYWDGFQYDHAYVAPVYEDFVEASESNALSSIIIINANQSIELKNNRGEQIFKSGSEIETMLPEVSSTVIDNRRMIFVSKDTRYDVVLETKKGENIDYSICELINQTPSRQVIIGSDERSNDEVFVGKIPDNIYASTEDYSLTGENNNEILKPKYDETTNDDSVFDITTSQEIIDSIPIELLYDINKAIRTYENSLNVYKYRINSDNAEAIFIAYAKKFPTEFMVMQEEQIKYQFVCNKENVVKSIKLYYGNNTDVDFDLKISEFNNIVNSIKQHTSKMDDLEKALYVHDYIVLNSKYVNKENDYSADERVNSFLINKYGICSDYALTYQYLMNNIGVDCLYIASNSMNHAWNKVKIENKWYNVDCTWDDPVEDCFGIVRHTYFLLDDEEFYKSHNQPDSVYYISEGYFFLVDGSNFLAVDKTYSNLKRSSSLIYHNGKWYDSSYFNVTKYNINGEYEYAYNILNDNFTILEEKLYYSVNDTLYCLDLNSGVNKAKKVLTIPFEIVGLFVEPLGNLRCYLSNGTVKDYSPKNLHYRTDGITNLTIREIENDYLKYDIVASELYEPTVTFLSSDLSVLAVTQSGHLWPFEQGTAIITIGCGDIYDACEIEVDENDNLNILHYYNVEINESTTCEEKGTVKYICRDCGKVVVAETQEKPHNYSESLVSLSENGDCYKINEVCNECGHQNVIFENFKYYETGIENEVFICDIGSRLNTLDEVLNGGKIIYDNLVIPDVVDGKKVVGVDLYYNYDKFVNISLPSTISTLNLNWSYIENINVENNPNYIYENGVLFNSDKTVIVAYLKSKEEKEYIIPEGVTRLKKIYNDNIEKLVFPNSYDKDISFNSNYCLSLESIEFSNNISNISLDISEALKEIIIKNPVCKFSLSNVSNKNITLVGYNDSTVEKYAKDNNFSFKSLGDANKSEFYEYEIVNNDEIKINRYLGMDTSVSIPNDINGKKVTILGKNLFDAVSSFDDIRIESIESVFVPDTISEIEIGAFDDLYRGDLKNVTISVDPNNNSFVVENNVLYDKQQKNIYYGSAICDEFFIPEGTENILGRLKIYSNTLYNAMVNNEEPNVEKEYGSIVHIPSTLKQLEHLDNDYIGTYIVSESNDYYSSIEGVLFSKDQSTLIDYPNLRGGASYDIPSSVTEISHGAFCGNFHLKNALIIEENVTKIGNGAFYDVYNLNLVIKNKDCEISGMALPSANSGYYVYGYADSVWRENNEKNFKPISEFPRYRYIKNEERIEPTDGSDGISKVHYYIDDYVESVLHYPETQIDVVEATCEQDGYISYVCKNCGETYNELIPATGHTFVSEYVVASQCGEKSYYKHVCSTCGYAYNDNYSKEKEHIYKIIESTSATCTEGGYNLYECTECAQCNKVYTSDKLEHNFSSSCKYISPTCTKDGYKVYTCEYCGFEKKEFYVGASGHNYYVKERNLPNINSIGTIKYVCSKCNDEYVSNIYPWDYDIIDDQNIRLTSYNAIDTEVVIPEEIDGFRVREIGKETFEAKTSSDDSRIDSITSIYIPASVTKIEDEAIPYVQNVYLDENNESFILEDNILYSCDYRKIHWGFVIGDDFYIKNGVEVIDRLILLSNEMYNIYQDMQAGIDYSEKYDMDHIKGVTIHIPASYIGKTPSFEIAEAYCVDNNNPIYSSLDGVLYSKDFDRLIFYPCCKYDSDFKIPTSVKVLEPYSFECASINNLENGLVIPRNVTTIEEAFPDASSFDVYVLNENMKPVWLGTSCSCNVYLYDSVIDSFKEKNSWINVYSLGDAPDISCFDTIIEQVDDLSVDDYLKKSYDDIINLMNEQKTESNYFSTQTEFDNAVSKLLTACNNLVPYLNLDIDVCNGTVNVLTNYNSKEDGVYSILFGNDVTLTATANEGYEFVGWYDTINNLYFSKNAEYSFKLTTNTSLKAVFVKDQSATLTFTTYSNWVQSTVTKTIDEWNAVTSIDELLPVVPYRYGYTNGRWVYDNAEVLAKLQTGEDVYLIPEYDEDDTSLPTPPSPDGDTPVLDLYYNLDAEANVGSFVMAAGIPENCQLESVGILFYYKNADEFDPTKFELLINNKMLAGRFNTDEADDIYIINMNKMSAYKNWAARGYVTYYDAEGNLKTVYSNQVNIVNREQV